MELTTMQAERVAGETRSLLEQRDLTTLAVTALSAAGGVIVAQTITDAVLGQFGLNANPQNLTDYASSVTVKTLVAIGFGVLASSLGGLGLVATGFMAVGALASAGADLIEGLFTTAPLGSDNPLMSAGHGGMPMMRNASPSGSATVVSSTSGMASDDVQFRQGMENGEEVQFR